MFKKKKHYITLWDFILHVQNNANIHRDKGMKYENEYDEWWWFMQHTFQTQSAKLPQVYYFHTQATTSVAASITCNLA